MLLVEGTSLDPRDGSSWRGPPQLDPRDGSSWRGPQQLDAREGSSWRGAPQLDAREGSSCGPPAPGPPPPSDPSPEAELTYYLMIFRPEGTKHQDTNKPVK